jgi:cation-transporting ATPase E
MTGDGVNDVLALKESDCSIAMASGSDAARTVSQVILLDSDFANMPRIVSEGRRSINNMQRSAALYLVKAMFSMIVAVLFIFLSAEYPFQPVQYTLINVLTISVPSFMLALEPNNEIISGKFALNVIKRAIPGTLTMVLNIVLLVMVNTFMRFSSAEFTTLAVVITGYTGFLTLFRISFPLNSRRVLLFILMIIAFILSITAFRSFFSLVSFTLPMIIVLLPMMIASFCLMAAILHLIKLVSEKKKSKGRVG